MGKNIANRTPFNESILDKARRGWDRQVYGREMDDVSYNGDLKEFLKGNGWILVDNMNDVDTFYQRDLRGVTLPADCHFIYQNTGAFGSTADIPTLREIIETMKENNIPVQIVKYGKIERPYNPIYWAIIKIAVNNQIPMNKNVVRITESQLQNIIMESVKKVLRENEDDEILDRILRGDKGYGKAKKAAMADIKKMQDAEEEDNAPAPDVDADGSEMPAKDRGKGSPSMRRRAKIRADINSPRGGWTLTPLEWDRPNKDR